MLPRPQKAADVQQRDLKMQGNVSASFADVSGLLASVMQLERSQNRTAKPIYELIQAHEASKAHTMQRREAISALRSQLEKEEAARRKLISALMSQLEEEEEAQKEIDAKLAKLENRYMEGDQRFQEHQELVKSMDGMSLAPGQVASCCDARDELTTVRDEICRERQQLEADKRDLQEKQAGLLEREAAVEAREMQLVAFFDAPSSSTGSKTGEKRPRLSTSDSSQDFNRQWINKSHLMDQDDEQPESHEAVTQSPARVYTRYIGTEYPQGVPQMRFAFCAQPAGTASLSEWREGNGEIGPYEHSNHDDWHEDDMQEDEESEDDEMEDDGAEASSMIGPGDSDSESLVASDEDTTGAKDSSFVPSSLLGDSATKGLTQSRAATLEVEAEEAEDLAVLDLDDESESEADVDEDDGKVDDEVFDKGRPLVNPVLGHRLHYEDPIVTTEMADSYTFGRSKQRDINEFEGNPQHCRGRDPISRHSQPAKALQDTMKILLASIEYVRARHDSHNETERKQMVAKRLQDSSRELAKLLSQQATDSASVILDSIANGTFSERSLLNKLKEILHDDPLESDDPGIYILLVFNKDGIPTQAYIGMSTNVGIRVGDHLDTIDGLDDDFPIKGGQSLYEIIKEAKKAGGTVMARVLVRVPRDQMDLLFLWEPALCAILGLYQRKVHVMDLRARLGLPCLSIKGLNASECFDGRPSDLRASAVRYGELDVALRKLRRARLALLSARIVIRRRSTSDAAKDRARKRVPSLKTAFIDAVEAYRQKKVDLLWNGKLPLLIVCRITASGYRYFKNDMLNIMVPDDALIGVFGKETVQRSKEKGTSLLVYARILATSESSHTSNFFPFMSEREEILLGQIELYITIGEGRGPVYNLQVRTPITGGSYNKQQLADFLFSCLPVEEQKRRRRLVEQLPLPRLPSHTPDLARRFLLGEIWAIQSSGSKLSNAYGFKLRQKGGPRKRSKYLLPQTLQQRDHIQAGHAYVYLRIVIPSHSSIFMKREEPIDMSKVGIEYYAGKGEWVAVEMPFLADDGLATRFILSLIVAQWERIGSPSLPSVARPVNKGDVPPPDRPGQPRFFFEWEIRARWKGGDFKVDLPRLRDNEPLTSMTIPKKVWRTWYPGRSSKPKSFLVIVKIDGWQKRRKEDCDVYFKLVSRSSQQGIWFRRSKKTNWPISEKAWAAIKRHQRDPPCKNSQSIALSAPLPS